MTTKVALACLALAHVLAARAEDRLTDPLPVDDSPTAYACTVETLRTGAACVFEGDPGSPFASTPARTAVQLSEVLCTAAARPPGDAQPDPAVKAACLVNLQRRIQRCAGPVAVLLDSAGQFVPTARACYAAMGEVLARARTQAATVAPCCRCLAEQGCGGARACLDSGPGTPLTGRVAACAARTCAQACSNSLPLPGEDDEEAPPPPPTDDHTRQRTNPTYDGSSIRKDI